MARVYDHNRMRRVASAFAMLVLTGCGGAQEMETRTGNTTAQPTLGVLPSTHVPKEELSDHMRLGWDLASSAMLIEMPMVPTRHDGATLTRWAEHDLGDWLQRMSEALTAASVELNAAANEDPLERVYAGAIVGVIYESVAQQLLWLPTPSELEREPEIAAAYRDILAFNAAPYLERSRAGYHACAANAEIHAEELGPNWATFCSGRMRLLPRARGTE